MIEAGHQGSPKVQSTQVLLVLLHAIMEALFTWEMALCFSTGLYGLGRVLGGEIDLNPCVKGFFVVKITTKSVITKYKNYLSLRVSEDKIAHPM